MHRQGILRSEGMLFIFDKAHEVTFWMKNTFFPLDIIFANDNGIIETVVTDTVPESLEPIFGGKNIRYVLEVSAGLSQQLGITAGAELQHPLIPATQISSCL